MRTSLICLALAIVLLCPFASAQWVHTSGPNYKSATCFAVSGTNLFAGTSGRGVFLSTNSGTSWTQVKSGLTSLNVMSLAVNGADIFAGTADSGVFRSTDNGTSWNQTNLASKRVTALAMCGSNLFAGAGWNGIYLSTDNGASWTVDTAGLGGNAFVAFLAVSGTHIFAGVGGGSSSSGGVFHSTSNGTGWSNIGLTNQGIAALVASGSSVFAVDGGSFFSSTNYGMSWTAVSSGLMGSYVHALAVSGTNLFAGTDGGGVLLSTNNGTSWTEVNSGLITTDVYSLCTFGTNLLAGTGCGVFVSTNNGSSWNYVQDVGGSCDVYVGALTIRGAELFAGAAWGDGRGLRFWCLYHSIDNGDSWVPQTAHGGNAIVLLDSDIFTGGWDGVFHSTDNGKSWTAVNKGLTSTSVQTLAVSGTNLFAGTADSGVFLSTDSGVSWSSVSVGLTGSAVRALAVSGTNLFAGTDTGGVFLSTNNGTSWAAVNEGLPRTSWATSQFYPISCVAINGQNIFAGTYGGGVFLSTNNGASWTAANTGLTSSLYVSALAINGTSLFASTGAGTFLSTNNGKYWQNTELHRGGEAFAFNETYVFVGTGWPDMGGIFGAGVWRRPLSEMITSAKSPSRLIPAAFELHQNYPNPFNPSTTIKFELPQRSHVTLTVYNLLGQQVATLVNETRNAGFYEVKFSAIGGSASGGDGGGLASGFYFYRLQAGDFIQTKKLVILK